MKVKPKRSGRAIEAPSSVDDGRLCARASMPLQERCHASYDWAGVAVAK
jgi:hypothetical protein